MPYIGYDEDVVIVAWKRSQERDGGRAITVTKLDAPPAVAASGLNFGDKFGKTDAHSNSMSLRGLFGAIFEPLQVHPTMAS
jgi:hypothetical protein